MHLYNINFFCTCWGIMKSNFYHILSILTKFTKWQKYFSSLSSLMYETNVVLEKHS